ncbi:MAG: RidA family protein [Clostridiales bacterium]|nr:RidA family protein [Clostridiales bacterium]
MKQCMNISGAPATVGPYSHAVKAGGFLYVSGQLGLDPETGVLAGGVEAQTRQSLENLKTIVEGCGLSLRQVVKTGIFLADINDFSKVNEIYAEYFTDEKPARSCVEVANLPKGGLVEIELIASADE